MESEELDQKYPVGEGWYNILDELFEKLDFLSERFNVSYTVMDIKEKFGTLRVYLAYDMPDDTDASLAVDIMLDLSVYAEHRSAGICEACGKPGQIRDLPWIKTLCKAHYKEMRLGYGLDDTLG